MTKRALICDDLPANYRKLSKALQKAGFECGPRVEDEAGLRESLARSHANQEWFDLVLIDLDLSQAGNHRNGASIYLSVLHDYPNETYWIYSTRETEKFHQLINQLHYRDVRFILFPSLLSQDSIRKNMAGALELVEKNRIFLVHGRNRRKTGRLSRILEDEFGLEVITFDDARKAVHGREYIYEIVLKGIELSHLTVVLFTDDEEVELRSSHRRSGDYELSSRSHLKRTQARANVYIEAGYALGVRPKRTLFVEWQSSGDRFTTPSDFSGIHVLRFRDNDGGISALKDRLLAGRCELHQ